MKFVKHASARDFPDTGYFPPCLPPHSLDEEKEKGDPGGRDCLKIFMTLYG